MRIVEQLAAHRKFLSIYTGMPHEDVIVITFLLLFISLLYAGGAIFCSGDATLAATNVTKQYLRQINR